MFKLYYITIVFFASFYFLSAQNDGYSSSSEPAGGIKTPKGSLVSCPYAGRRLFFLKYAPYTGRDGIRRRLLK